MNNVNTIMCDLPNTIGGFTIAVDDFFTVVLNSNLSHEKNLKTYYHELQHIKNSDFNKNMSAEFIEIMAHNT